MENRICIICGTEYTPTRKDQKTCSNKQCKRGMWKEYRQKNTSATDKITVEEVQRLLNLAYPIWSIAQRFQVDFAAISEIIKKNKLKPAEKIYGGIPCNTKNNHYHQL